MIVILLPTNQCNLRCKYCTAEHGNDIMTDDTLVNAAAFSHWVVGEVQDIQSRSHLEWHAGEPLLLPISFYERAEWIFDDIGYEPKRTLCTNLTLWNDEWNEFCHQYDYKISTSLDGPQYIHDANRGAGTWKKVVTNMVKLEESNTRFGCISVLSKLACQNIIDVYEFFKAAQLNVKFSLCLPVIDQKTPIDAMTTLFDLWWEDKASTSIHPFNQMVKYILNKKYRTECHGQCNHGIVSVDAHGNVHVCQRFVSSIDTGRFGVFGNVNTDSFEDIWYGEKRTRFLEYIDRLPTKCYSCPYLDWCGGGCAFDSVCQHGTDKQCGTDCDYIKAIMEHIEDRIGFLRGFDDIPTRNNR